MRDARQTDTDADQTAATDGADVPLIKSRLPRLLTGKSAIVIA